MNSALLMPGARTALKHGLDVCTRTATRCVHRILPSIPALDEWPGTYEFLEAVHRRSLAGRYERILAWAARRHRARLRNTIVIGITGSGGKTTAKDILAAILSTLYPVEKTGGTSNYPRDVARTILRTRRSAGACVVELSGGSPGALDGPLEIVRPDIAVITNIGTDHYRAFHSQDAIALEKGKLVAAVPPDGTAVLNADDPRVFAMRARCTGRVLTFGCSEVAMLTAKDVTAAWPDRLSFTALWRGESVRVRTQLLGAHWTATVLAAMGAAIAIGVPLREAAEAVATVPPFTGRMSPVTLDGITFIRDDWKAPVWTIPSVLDFLRQARAERKVLLIGTISSTHGDASAAYVAAARQALAVADHVIFVGPQSFAALRAKNDAGDKRLFAYSSARAASDFLKNFLRQGDLVLIKSSNAGDHLVRLILARSGGISCWRSGCAKQLFCDACSWRFTPSDQGTVPAAPDQTEPGPGSAPALFPGAERPRLVVGFGNRGERYQGTPHNIGHAVLDRLAAILEVPWTSQQGCTLGRTERDGRPLYLVKPDTFVNLTGGALKALAGQLGFEPSDCLLVHDDLSLPLGTVRVRMRGSDGGHRGVRSVLEVFQTDQFPRVKIGIRRDNQSLPPAEYVLTPFPSSAAALLDQACVQAVERILMLLRPGPSVR